MTDTLKRFHTRLRRVAIFLAVINLVSFLTLDMREWLVYVDPWIWFGVVPLAFVIALPILPWLLPLSPEDTLTYGNRRLLVLVGLAMCCFEVLWFYMIFMAMFCRGPNWNFYWPWELRYPRIVAINNIDLSQWVWRFYLDQPRPLNPWLREWFGITLAVVHMLVVPLSVGYLLSRVADKARFCRMFALVVSLQLLAFFPLKIGLRWLFDVKYVVSMPEWFFNI